MKTVQVKVSGKFKKATKRLNELKAFTPRAVLDYYGQIGVEALANATPVDSGLTASSWYYIVQKTDNGYDLVWRNRNIVDGVNVALLIQYGHATKNGLYVSGFDYINPALQEVFKNIVSTIEKEVKG